MFGVAQSWTLSWSDEFNGAANSAIDATNWTYDTGILNVNNEVEYYCAPGSNTAPCVAGTSGWQTYGQSVQYQPRAAARITCERWPPPCSCWACA